MKKLVKQNYYVMAILLAFISCEQSQEHFDRELSQRMTGPENPYNPIDSIGVKHNVIVNKILTSYPYSDTTFELVAEYSHDVLDQTFNDYNGNVLTRYEFDRIIEDTADFFLNDIENMSISQESKDFLSDFFVTIKDFNFEVYIEIKDFIIDREDYLINGSHTISQQDKDLLLALTSIARHSIYYWAEEEPVGSWIKIGIVAASDIMGGYEGYVSSGGDRRSTISKAVEISAVIALVIYLPLIS